jgi:glycosyltransferase involved in cell wall biosynthesis
VDVVFGPEIFGQRYGGISRYVIELHRRLPDLGVSSTVFAGVHRNGYLTGVDRVRGIHVPVRLQKARTRPFEERANEALLRAWTRSGRRSSVYHQTYYHGDAGRHRRGPVVVTAYDLIHAKLSRYFAPDDSTVAEQRKAFARADLVLAISHSTARDLQEILGVPAAKISVTHLGVSPPPDEPRASTGRRRPFLLYVGLRYGYKNWARLVQAVAICRAVDDLDLVCVGGPFTHDETGLLTELGLSNRVRQAAADDDLLDAYYREAVAFVYPSMYEGFGLPPLEAMARDCPVLAANVGSIPEVLGDAAVLADPASVESLADGLTQVVRPDRRSALVQAGNARVRQFTWDRTAASTVHSYRSLVG